MQRRTARRLLALVAGLAISTATSAYAQDSSRTGGATTDTIAPSAGALDTTLSGTSASRDTTDTMDTTGVHSSPGYQGMERDTTLVPNGASSDPPRLDPSSTTAGDSTHVTHDTTQ